MVSCSPVWPGPPLSSSGAEQAAVEQDEHVVDLEDVDELPRLIWRDGLKPQSEVETYRIGMVVAEGTIDELGNLVGVRLLEYPPWGDQAEALERIQTMKFEPAIQNGKPVPVRYSFTINHFSWRESR